MSRSANTVFYFGIYLLLEGLFLMVAPADLLTNIGIPDPTSIWRSVVGFVVLVLGYYYVRNAKAGLTPFFTFTVHIRVIQFIFFLYLYFFQTGTMALVAFSFVELAAGIWTFMALKKES